MSETGIMQPLAANKRIAIIDILRGWALLGVAIGNYSDFSDFGRPVNYVQNVPSIVLGLINHFIFAAKSWTLLSILFGYGFAMVFNNVSARGQNPLLFFCKRMFWLFVIGLVNSAFWYGDILKDYAALGFVLLLFYKCSTKTIFYVGLSILFFVPFVFAIVANHLPYDYDKAVFSLYSLYYSHKVTDIFLMNFKGTYLLQMKLPEYAITVHCLMLACMLLGFSAQRINLFNRLADFRQKIKKLFWLSFFGMITFLALLILLYKSSVLNYFNPQYWIVFATMSMIASGIILLYLNDKLKALFTGFQAVGRMTLTNYIIQNIIALFLFLNAGLGLFNTQPYWLYFLLAVIIFTLQIFFSIWWLSRYNYGPVEWVWRQLTYGRRLPMRKCKTE